MRTRQTLILITMNGSCNRNSLRPCVISPNLKQRLNVRQVRNFTTFNLSCLGIAVNLFMRGNFKITLRKSKAAAYVINNIDKVLNYIISLMEFFYKEPLLNVSIRVTQIACGIPHSIKTSPNFKLNYNWLSKSTPVTHNSLTYHHQGFTIIHQINWDAYESGSSSFYFNFYKNETERALCGLKLFNNLKAVAFYYSDITLNLSAEIISFVSSLVENKTSSRDRLSVGCETLPNHNAPTFLP